MISKKRRVASFKSRQGSILLEALLSVIILSVGITVIVQSMTGSLRASVFSSDYSQAMLLLDNKMVEYLEQSSIEANLSEENSFSEPFDRFKYLLKTEPLSDQPNLNKVHLEVNWKSQNIEKGLSLETYLVKPKEEK